MPTPKLFLIDAHALCYRAFFAIKGLTNSRGQATNAVYGFLNTLKKVVKEYEPAYMAVCFDTPARTHREKTYAKYKIQRPVMPDDLISQIPYIKDVVRAYNLCLLEKEGYEADDLIATVVRQMKDKDVEIVIVSDDKDIFQLAGERVRIYHSRKDALLERKDVQKILDIDPQYLVDYIGLAGDSTDNIPGVKGIGPVTAKKLIRQYGRLETIYDHLADIDSAVVRDRLTQQKDEAFLSKSLAILDDQVPLNASLENMRTDQPDEIALLRLFNDLEFKRFAEELAGQVSRPQAALPEKKADGPGLRSLIDGVRASQTLFFISDRSADSGGGMFCSDGQSGLYRVPGPSAAALNELFDDMTIVKVTHDVKEQLKLFSHAGWRVANGFFDVMLAGYLLSPSQTAYDIAALSWAYLKTPLGPLEGGQTLAPLVPLYPRLRQELEDKGLWKLFEEIEMPLAEVLARMELTGIRLDQDFLKILSGMCQEKITRLIAEVYDLAGQEFNVNSPKQLSEILFAKLKLPVIKKTKTGFSTNEEVLKELSLKHALPSKILEYRQLAKLKSTYIDALPKLTDPQTGKIHASFNQTMTETGRLSSSNPNLQNIPIRTDIGRQIRKAFIASGPESWILAADYSQIELRVLAHLSGDPALRRAFVNGEDIHRYTASLVYDVPAAGVTPGMRTTAKRVNFGIIYGMSAWGLAKDLSIPPAAAEDFIQKYFARYPKVREFMDACVSRCEKDGYVMTLLKRRRYIPEIKSPNPAIRQFAQRQAMNTPVQGSAADLIKLAMIRIQKELEERGMAASMLITVHDELVFDVPQKELNETATLIRTQMESAMKLSVPLSVVVKKGKNWLETEDME